jgi:hypothetical protein
MRTAVVIATLCVVTVFVGTPMLPAADRVLLPDALEAARVPITIIAPPTALAGTVLCFDVVALSGLASAIAEVNDVKIPMERVPTPDPAVTRFCGLVPAGASGSFVVITAVGTNGSTATARVTVL